MGKILKNKKIIIAFVLLIALILVFYKIILSGSDNKVETAKKEISEEEVIPTVDSSVIVDLTKEAGSYEVNLSIKNIPQDTNKIEYELSYQTEKQGFQGIKGSLDLTGVKDEKYEKSILLGTCSSGRCVYHAVVGKISLSVKFNGNYGDKIFEKEYEI